MVLLTIRVGGATITLGAVWNVRLMKIGLLVLRLDDDEEEDDDLLEELAGLDNAHATNITNTRIIHLQVIRTTDKYIFKFILNF
jgi:hypothetical protein